MGFLWVFKRSFPCCKTNGKYPLFDFEKQKWQAKYALDGY